MHSKKDISDKKYSQYNDFYFKSLLLKRANGVLRFLALPYEVTNFILSEYTTAGPGISRIDFAGDAKKDEKTVSLILECQSKLPTEEDIKRFFQFVSSLRIFKNNNVELYILCTEKAPYNEKEFVINENCIYTMHVISLKEFSARKILKCIEDKLKNNDIITDEDIASLQLIVYTDYDESELQILIQARLILEKISENSNMDINEKKAIIYLFDVLSTNMLNDDEIEKYEEETYMLLNPTDRYLLKRGRSEGRSEGRSDGIRDGKLEVAMNLLEEGFSIEKVVELTGLSERDILNAK